MPKEKSSKLNSRMLSIVLLAALIFSFIYLFVRISFLLFYSRTWDTIVFGSIFLVAEVFALMHSINYIWTLAMMEWKSRKTEPQPEVFTQDYYPPIAVIVPSYHEPIDILEETLLSFYNLSYPNKYLYLLDDTRYDRPWDTPEKVAEYKTSVDDMCRWIGVNIFRRKWRGAKAGIINDFLKFRQGATFESLEYLPYQSDQPLQMEKYIAIFDADMNPFPDFLEPICEYMEKHPRAAFTQTPQYYSNFENNRVAKAAGLQQMIFYEYICEGKGEKGAMFCCGSNVLLRIEALQSIGGFDESSVTEDFATSLRLHLKGWSSFYFNKISGFGNGPEDLGAFLKQQFRWASGTLEMAIALPRIILKHGRQLSFGKWWEYFMSATHYFAGWYFFIMYSFPIMYLFFNIPSLFMTPTLYFAVFTPYILCTISAMLWALNTRNYKPSYMLNSVLISAITFPVLMKAAVCAIWGIRGTFIVTPKGKSEPLPLRELWPQLSMMFACLAAFTWGLERIYYERVAVLGLIANMIWCLYNFCILTSVIYFNKPEESVS